MDSAGEPVLPEPLAGPTPGSAQLAAPGARRRVAVLAVGATAAVTALGLPLGLGWARLAPAVPVRVIPDGLAFARAQPSEPVAADGWFLLLGFGFGILVAVAVWAVRPIRGSVGLLALTIGAVGAALLAWGIGRQLGQSAFEAAVAQAEPGAVIARPAQLRIVRASWWPPLLQGAPLAPALAGTITYTLLAAWSRFPSLRPPSP